MAHERTTFFTIDRKLLESEVWLEEPFTRGQAWVDLIGRANYADRTKLDGANAVTIYRGQVVTSELALAARWKWSRKKVRMFLRGLEQLGQIAKKGTSKGTIITIENYGFYQDRGPAHYTAEDTAQGQRRASGGYTQKQINKGNKENKREREGLRPCGPNGRLTLTAQEEEQFREDFAEADRFIEEMDEYIGATGKTYKDDYLALRRWAKNDKKFAAATSGRPAYKSGLEKVTEEIENGTFSF